MKSQYFIPFAVLSRQIYVILYYEKYVFYSISVFPRNTMVEMEPQNLKIHVCCRILNSPWTKQPYAFLVRPKFPISLKKIEFRICFF